MIHRVRRRRSGSSVEEVCGQKDSADLGLCSKAIFCGVGGVSRFSILMFSQHIFLKV